MSILEKIISVIAPHTCLECGVEADVLLCENCRQSLPLVPSRCYRCKTVTDDYAVCRTCQPSTPLRQVVVYTHYQAAAKELIHRIKYERAQSGVREIAQLLYERSGALPNKVVLTHIPTASSRVRLRGYDHAKLTARFLARESSLPHFTLLRRLGQAQQMGAHRAERLRQLQQAFRPVHKELIQGAHIVLIDDVLTTGATVETAARILRRAGAARVSAIVFAQA